MELKLEMENPQFKETHCIKQSLDKEIYEALSEEQRQALPIIGGMKPLVKKAAPQMNVGSTFDGAQAVENTDDLPF